MREDVWWNLVEIWTQTGTVPRREPGPDEPASASPGWGARAVALERTMTNDKAETALALTSAGVEEKVWVAAVDLGVASRGSEITLEAGNAVKGDEGLHELSSGVFIFVRRARLGDIADVLGQGNGADSRVREPVQYDTREVRRERLTSAVAHMRWESLQD